MANILILSGNLLIYERWKNLLCSEHQVFISNNSNNISTNVTRLAVTLLIVDGDLLQNHTELLMLKVSGAKILLIGRNWSEERQINILVSGIAGYCELKSAEESLLNATNSILQGDIWVQRHLVPKIIETLINLTNTKKTAPQDSQPFSSTNLQTLTLRELDVAKMIRKGENNKMIAAALNISERTVKAHLTSIFQKLHVQDRVHLALLLKELH